MYYKEDIKLCFNYIKRMGVFVDINKKESRVKIKKDLAFVDWVYAYNIDKYWILYDEKIKEYIIVYERHLGEEINIYTFDKVENRIHILYDSIDYDCNPFETSAYYNSPFMNLLKKAKENKRVMKLIRQ